MEVGEMKYAKGTQNTRVYDKFEYFSEDLDCEFCSHFKGRVVADRSGGHGCGRSVCEFQDIRDEAIRNRRIKRARGWQKKCLTE
jgi:hypothetical protein